MTIPIRVETIERVNIEVAPQAQWGTDDQGREILGWTGEVAALPAIWLATLTTVCGGIDHTSCEACGDGVGYVLIDDDHATYRGVKWYELYMIKSDTDQEVHVVCADCGSLE